MNGAAMVTAVLDQGGFDVAQAPRAMVLGWVNEILGELVARSKWHRASVAVGTTSVGVSQYPAVATVVEADTLRVGTARANRVSTEQLQDLQSGDLTLYPGRMVFAPYFSADGNTEGVEVFPTPTVAGSAITAQGSIAASAVVDDGTEVSVVPADVHGRIVTASIALGRERLFGIQGDETLREGLVTTLRERRNSRLGGGVQQLVVLRRRRRAW